MIKKFVMVWLALIVAGTASHVVAEGRIIENINSNWLFHRGGPTGGKADFTAMDLDDSRWERITIPNSWNVTDGADGGENYYRGNAWYRKKLYLPETYRGKDIYLKFGAANKVAKVFFNGDSLTTHDGGYAAFTVDITGKVRFGHGNILAVRVNNEAGDTAPLSGDFTQWGGLYRSVRLLVMDRTHIAVQDYASSGIYVTIPNDPSIAKTAEVTIETPVQVAPPDVNAVSVTAVLRDVTGREVEAVTLQPGKRTGNIVHFTGTMDVRRPHLWNGLEDPYLYSVEVTVARRGDLIDRVTQKIGFRYFSVDPDKGFFLNGKSYPLRGVALHQDREDYGNAVPDDIRARDFQLIDELGANTLRLAHYQHSQFVYDTADKMGLVLWTEIPLVNSMTETGHFTESTVNQLKELIKQNYNHPSIVAWGLQNEFGGFYGFIRDSELPEAEQYAKGTDLVQLLAKTARELDPDRLLTQAIMAVPFGQGLTRLNGELDWASNEAADGGQNQIDKFMDLASLNVYYGWYTPAATDLDAALTKYHTQYPDAVLGISEYGAGGSPWQHQKVGADFTWDVRKSMGPWHPEEYQNYVHETEYAIIQRHPELWATHVWNLFNFGADNRAEGGTRGLNDKGLVTYDRQIRKDAFYFYKAQWNQKDPFVYITSRRYTDRSESTIPIKVYSNLDKVTLTVNGVEYGGGKKQQSGVFVWDTVKIQAHDNLVVASAVIPGGGSVQDSVKTWVLAGE